MTKPEMMSKILYTGFLPNIIKDNLPVVKCVEQIANAGIEALEVSCRRPDVLAQMRSIKKEFPHMVLAVSSLIDDGRMQRHIVAAGHPLPTIQQVVDAGADALVSILPFREPTYKKHGSTHIIIPGVSIPGEAHQALDWGANLIKFSNPALLGGAAFFKGIEAATHRAIPYCVTGGMRPEIIPAYVEANILVFIAGFDLILGQEYRQLTEKFDGSKVGAHLKEYVQAVGAARKQYQPQIPFEGKNAPAIALASGRCLNIAD
jgi:2-keto-3-deoxy-6-phosphogluconate aldolase